MNKELPAQPQINPTKMLKPSNPGNLYAFACALMQLSLWETLPSSLGLTTKPSPLEGPFPSVSSESPLPPVIPVLSCLCYPTVGPLA